LCIGSLSAYTQTTHDTEQEIRNLNLPGVTITEIENIPQGNYTPKGGKMIPNFPATLRVAFTAKPTPDSEIKNEVWLPKDNWNGRFLGTGNGGGGSWLIYGSLASGVLRGFATANTDMGTSPGANEIIGHPEKWADFGYRSTHEMTVSAKAILKVYYKKPAHHSYFVGCSTGGQQALMEAQRFPEDYNGIIAGAPANNRTHLHTYFIWNSKAVFDAAGKQLISKNKMAFFSKLVTRNCTIKDVGSPGDNFLTDPRVCNVDFSILPRCPGENVTDSCFSSEEITALEKLFTGPVNSRTSERIYTPYPIGGTQLDETNYQYYPFRWVFGKDFDYRNFDFDKDMAKVDSILGPLLNANNPDLEPMKKNGGKILMYTGTSDQLVPYQDALNYYDRVIQAQHGLKQTQDFFRFYLIPGMGHCGGGAGLNEFGQGLSLNIPQDGEHDVLTSMVNWVEKNIPPDKLIVTAFYCCDTVNKIHFQRPVYPYPSFPLYYGGNPDSPSSYKEADHPLGGIPVPDQKYLK